MVVDRENAAHQNYEETILVDVEGNKSDQVNNLAENLAIKVSTLPAEEKKPEQADFLIILGKDKKDI